MLEPLTPADCDLRNYPFMPLDVVRLRDSDLAALESAEAFRAAVLLWCAAWHQIPAASLPDDDRILANLAGFGRVVKEWVKVREGALRGWQLCSDGRLYHPVIADKALEALAGKHKQLWKTECARIEKHNQRSETKLAKPSFDEFLSTRLSVKCPVGQMNNVLPDIPPLSGTLPDPKEREREKDTTLPPIDIGGDSNIPAANPPPSTLPGLICKGLREVGIANVNPSNQTLLALVKAGATIEEFTDAAMELKSRGEGKFDFNYVLGTVKGRRKDAANLVLHKGALPASTAKEAGRNIAASSIFKPEHTQHLQAASYPLDGNSLRIENQENEHVITD